MAFVLDCSLTMAWVFPDEATESTDRLRESLVDGRAYVPSLWPVEVGNVLLIATRRGRITRADWPRIHTDLGALPIEIDPISTSRFWTVALDLATKHQLSVYDAHVSRTGGPVAVASCNPGPPARRRRPIRRARGSDAHLGACANEFRNRLIRSGSPHETDQRLATRSRRTVSAWHRCGGGKAPGDSTPIVGREGARSLGPGRIRTGRAAARSRLRTGIRHPRAGGAGRRRRAHSRRRRVGSFHRQADPRSETARIRADHHACGAGRDAAAGTRPHWTAPSYAGSSASCPIRQPSPTGSSTVCGPVAAWWPGTSCTTTR